MLMNDDDYLAVLEDVKSQVNSARRVAVRAMNTGLVVLYWNVGRVLDERSAWGNRFLTNLARDVGLAYPEIREIGRASCRERVFQPV
jgi:Ser-tRNA(Ala) deacylase AlaX